MAQSRALAGQGEAITQTEQVVTSALNYMVWCSLPSVVSGGAGAAVDYGHVVTVFANGEGPVEVVDALGNRVTIVKPFQQVGFRARATGHASLRRQWEVLDPQKVGTELVTIADLAVTDGTIAASAVTMPATYVEATQESSLNTALDANSAASEALLATSFGEVEVKVNAIIAALGAMGIIAGVDQTEGTDSLALADNQTWQVVDDSERTVTSARSTPTYITLPKIVAAGTGTAVPPLHNIRIAANAAGSITVRDFYHRKVCVVAPWTSRTVLAMEATNNTWADLGTVSPALNALVPAPKVAPLVVTLPTYTASAADFAAAYGDDATYLAAVEAAADAVFAGMATSLAVSFAQVETTVNAILVALETATLHAAA
jgi:hypothetical protein